MTEVDLGPVVVTLTTIPRSKGVPASSAAISARTISDRQDAALQGLVVPKLLPRRLKFLEATVISAPVEMFIATFHEEGSGKAITLAQTAVDQLKGDQGKPTLFAPGVSVGRQQVGANAGARVLISEDPGWRAARFGLVWLKDGQVFQLSGRGFSEAELSDIAASV